MRHHFQFSHSVAQRCSATLFALLIPILFALAFSITQPLSITEKNTRQSQLLFISIPQATIITTKQYPLRIEKNKAIKEKAAKAEMPSLETLTADANLAKQSNAHPDIDLMQSTNPTADLKSDVFEKQNQAKAAWAAYQDARSDIQKMASRRGIALQSNTPNKYDEFQTAANNAVIPDCLEKGASSKLGLDSVKGLLLAPALVISALRGKCK